VILGALAGVLAGVGLLLVVSPLLPQRADLGALTAHLRPAPPAPATARAAPGSRESLGRYLRARLVDQPGRLTVPRQDLALLQRTVEEFLVEKLLTGLLGLLFAAILTGGLSLLGLGLPGGAGAAVLLALVLAAGLFVLPDLTVRDQAKQARRDFRYAIGSFLDLVALERAADGSVGQSLVRAAAIGRGWAFVRISETLTQARLAGITPWQGMAELAEELGVRGLSELADIVGLAGTSSVSIYDALRAQAASLRSRERADVQTESNERTERMTIPSTLTAVTFIFLVLYPAATLIR